MQRRYGATPRFTMAPLALLLLAACALTAPLAATAASIPDASTELHRKIPIPLSENQKEPLENDLVHAHEEPHDFVKDIENELRAKPAADIPVEVVVENIEPSIKINEVSDEVEIKRPQVDLRNPGPPQRQEHETQNPEQHSDDILKVATVKENIKQSQILLKESFKDITNDVQTWFSDNSDQNKIQQSFQKLRETFTSQIQKLNDTLHVLGTPEESKPSVLQEDSKSTFQKAESSLKLLTDEFNNGVDTISAGVNIVASLKSAHVESEAREDAGAEPTASELPAVTVSATEPPKQEISAQPEQPTTNRPQNFVVQAVSQAFNTLWDRTNTSFQNIQALISPQQSSPPAGAQADNPSSPPGTGFLGGINLPFAGIFNLTGNPVQQFLSNFTIFNAFGATTRKPVVPTPVSQASAEKPLESKPSEMPADAPATTSTNAQPAAQPAAQNGGGPIRDFLANNQLVQSFQNTVQSIQNAIIRQPERVRDVETSGTPSSKGGWFGRPGYPSGSGNNNDSDRLSEQKAVEIKGPVQEEPKKPEEIKEVKPEISEKSE